jgi:RNA polymerase sigma-70 factor, ECF subfamily
MDDESTVLTDLTHCLHLLLDGLPQAAVARTEAVSLSGMKSRVQRGRRRLAELLEQCCTLTLDARGVPMDYTRTSGCGGSCGCS